MNTHIKSDRILSLDVFRGLTIALMIVVNSQATLYSYSILAHSQWNGCTLADVVFPFFLFIVGLTSVISLNKHLGLESKAHIYKSIIRRSLILFALGIFLNIFPLHLNFSTLRIYGILQRIALCYLICSLIYLNTGIKTQILIFIGILLGYWLIMTQIPVPGLGINQLSPGGSWVSYFDLMIFSPAHLLEKTYDPEGFFTTIPSIATTLSGVLIGSVLLAPLNQWRKLFLMTILASTSLLLGWLWGISFPINKNLRTSSYVLWTSGLALIIFAFCYLLIDILNYKKWALPLKIFGMNAIFAFVFHVILLKLQFAFRFPTSQSPSTDLVGVITYYLFGSFSAQNAALFYAFSFLLLNFLVVAFLYHRKWFIRI